MFHKQIATFSVEVHQNSFKKLILRSHAISDFEDLSFPFSTQCLVLSVGAEEPSNLQKLSYASMALVKSD